MSLYRRRFLGVLAAAVAGLSGCSGTSNGDETTSDGTTTAKTTTVTVRDGELTPASLEVAAGQTITVVFENRDDRAHVLRGTFADFEVHVLPGASVTRTVSVPENPGEYTIDCDESTGTLTLEVVLSDVMGGCSLE